MAVPGISGLPKVQNFKVHKVLGKGSYGKVYKVQRNSDEQYYALKETDLGNMSQLERMDAVNEVRLLVSMNHTNVIRYHEAFLNNSKLCVIMEYAPFGDLRYYIQKGQRLQAPFPEEAIWRIFLQLCRGLQSLHANQIIHRDIKPANIFLCQNDLLKIGDLGVAKALTRASFAKTLIGTPMYMAPEVWEGKPYSYSSDLWSLGCVLYEMLTFRTPMVGVNQQDLKIKICSGRFIPVAAGRYSPDLINFCHQLLALDPRKRPAPDSILNSPAAAKWLRVLPSAPPPQQKMYTPASSAAGGLLNTIYVPRDLRELPKKLPPPSYDSDKPRLLPPRISASGIPTPAALGPVEPQRQRPNTSAPSSRAPSAPRERMVPAAGLQGAAPFLPAINGLQRPNSVNNLQRPHSGNGLLRHNSGNALQRQNSANVLQPPAMRPGPRRISYS